MSVTIASLSQLQENHNPHDLADRSKMSIDLIIIKLVVAVSAVLSLSLVAEHVSPKAAGIWSGFPLGAAIVLFFYGVEISPQFASDSSIYTLVGLIGTQAFSYFYYRASLRLKRLNILISTITSIGGFLFVSWLLHFITLGRLSATIIAVFSQAGFSYLFREIKDSTISNKIKLTHKVIVIRAFMAASMMLTVIGVARLVGSKWAGLFSAFPSTLLPLLLIIHFTYDKGHVHTIIKHLPRGLGSVITYAVTVSLSYPVLGVYLGTVLAFIMAALYLSAFFFVTTKFWKQAPEEVTLSEP